MRWHGYDRRGEDRLRRGLRRLIATPSKGFLHLLRLIRTTTSW